MSSVGGRDGAIDEGSGLSDLHSDDYEYYEEDGEAVFRALVIAAAFCLLLLGGAAAYFSEPLFGHSLITLALR